MLLLDLLHELYRANCSFTCLIDQRLKLPAGLETQRTNFIRIKPSLVGRLRAEWQLKQIGNKFRTAIYFGNLPPLLKSSAKETYIFVQNNYIISKDLGLLPDLKSKIKFSIERLWFRHCAQKSYKYLVQTEHMKFDLLETLNSPETIIIPFANLPAPTKKQANSDKSFIYVASGEEHKNHTRLIDAWTLLAAEQIRPKLSLVLSKERHPQLVQQLQKSIDQHSLNVSIEDGMTKEQLDHHYTKFTTLIFPSRFESFGLPLLEAKSAGLDIIASELDYVRDLLDPCESFAPTSAKSITRAVKRYLEIEEKRHPVRSPQDILQELKITK